MQNIVVMGNLADMQTGMYIIDACRKLGYKTAGIDIRRIYFEVQKEKVQDTIISETRNLSLVPDLIIILKGMEMTVKTLQEIKKIYPEAKIVNWFFDKYYLDKEIWNSVEHFEFFKLFDYFFCSLKGVSDKMNSLGFNNFYYLPEAASLSFNRDVYYNYYEEKKFGGEVTFIGTIGFLMQHKDRVRILKHLIDNGINIKIYGDIRTDDVRIPREIREKHMSANAVNEGHSLVCQTSKINLGIDQDVEVLYGWSARLYRVLCCGGLYLTSATKGIEDYFIVNKKGEPITENQDLVVYYDDEDLLNHIDTLLSNEELRQKIASNGKAKVMKYHLFGHRIEDMMKIVYNNSEVI